jgi:hypothetical protein
MADAKPDKKTTVVGRVVPAIAMWGIARLLAMPKVIKASQKLDRKADKKKDRMMRSIRKAGDNARGNPGWLAAGAAAFALGVGLFARAAKGK